MDNTSLPYSESDLRDALQGAIQRSDVKALIDLHGEQEVGRVWRTLDPLTKASLNLCRQFDGIIVQGPQS